ncbi:MAG: Asp23/Gls24 family envelope stress response protein [Clostridia bacterium]|nr:Asp23/Gls24 family envelope stress response protein [Clostridia bacterium]
MVLKTNGKMGEIYISNAVIAEVAGAVASRCYGVVGMATRNKKDGLVSLVRPEAVTKGIGVTVDDDGIVIDMHVIIEYGMNINSVCRSVVNRVRYTVEKNVGLKVNRVNVKVEGIRVSE